MPSDDDRLPRDGLDPSPDAPAAMACADCGETFPRREVRSATKGTLVCPACGSTAIRDADAE